MTFHEKYEEWKQNKNEQNYENSSNSDTSPANTSESFNERYTKWKWDKDGEGIVNNLNNRITNWFKNSENLFKDSKSRYANRTGSYKDSYVSDSSDWYSSATSRRTDLDIERYEIQSILKKYSNYLDKDFINEVNNAIDSTAVNFSNVVEAAAADKEYWGQWENEDAYNSDYWKKYYDDWGKYAEAEDFAEYSVPTGSKVILSNSDLFGGDDVYNFINNLGTDFSNVEAGKVRLSNVTSAKSKLKDVDQTNLGYRDYIKAFYDDKHFDERYGPYTAYTYMTDENIGIYNYLYAKEGKERADEYLKYIEEKLNADYGTDEYENMSGIEKALYWLPAGIDQFAGGIRQLFAAEKLPTSQIQYTSGMVQNEADETSPVLGTLYKAGTTVSNMLPSIALGAINPALGSAAMGLSAGGNAYGQALEMGYSQEGALLYGTLVGASEATLQHLLGGIGKLAGAGNITSKVVSKASMINNSFLRVAAKYGIKVAGETIEEELQNFLEPAFRTIIFGEDYDAPTIDEIIETAVITALTTGAIEGVSDSVVNMSVKDKYGAYVTNIASNTLELNPDDALASNILTNDSTNISGEKINTLLERNSQYRNQSNKSDIKQALIEKGVAEKEADSYSEWLGDAINGERLTKNQQKILSNNEAAQEVLLEGINAKGNTGGTIETIIKNEDGKKEIAEKSVSEHMQAVNRRNQKANNLERLLNGTISPEEYSRLIAETTSEIPQDMQNDLGEQAVGEIKTTSQALNAEATAGVQEANPQSDVNTNITNAYQESATESTAIEKASQKYGAQAGAMLHTYQAGQDVDKYDKAYESVYNYAHSGTLRLEAVKKLKSVSYLTENQIELAYETGEAAAKSEAAALDEENKAQANGKTERKIGTVRGEGVTVEDLNEIQKDAYKIISGVSKITGLDIVLYKSEANENRKFVDAQGKYSRNEPGTIYIDINAGLKDLDGDAGTLANYTMLRTFSHEFTHFIEKWNPILYNELRKAVFDRLAEQGENIDELIELKMEKAEAKDEKVKKSLQGENTDNLLYYDMASRETVAQAMTDILPDSKFINDLAKNHKTIFNKLVEKLKEFLASIKAYFTSINENSPKEAKAMKQQYGNTVRYVENIVELFDKAAIGAVENYQTTVATDVVDKSGYALTEHELQAITNYKSSESYKINYMLREKIPLSEMERNFVDSIDRALKKLPLHKGKIYRNIGFDNNGGKEALDRFIAEHIQDNIIIYKAYTSASTKEDGYVVDDKYAAHIIIPESANAHDIDGIGDNSENEVIYERGTTFVVSSISYDSKGMPTIYLKEDILNEREMERAVGFGKGEHGHVYSEERGEAVQQVQFEEQGDSYVQSVSETDTERNADGGLPGLHTRRQVSETTDDTQYQSRDYVLTDREVLELAANEIKVDELTEGEKSALEIFKKRINIINDLQKQRIEQGRIYREQQFAKGGDRKAAEQAKNRMDILDSKLKKASEQLLDVEQKAVLKSVLQKARGVVEKIERREAQEKLKRYRERKNTTEMRHKVIKTVKDLNNYLLNGDKKKHVPESLKVAVAETLAMFNMDTVGADKRLNGYTDENGKYHKGYNQLIAEAKDEEVRKSLEETRDRIQNADNKVSAKLDALQRAYKEIAENTNSEISMGFDENVSNAIEELSESLGNKPLRDMNYVELESLHKVLKMVKKTITNANKAFAENIKEGITETANKAGDELDALKRKNKGTTDLQRTAEQFAWNNRKPIYAFEKVGSKTILKLFMNIRKGEDTWVVDVDEAKQFVKKAKRKHGYKKWHMEKEFEFESDLGQKFSLTTNEIMSMYAYSERDEDKGKIHLRLGGFVFDENARAKIKRAFGFKLKVLSNDATFYTVSDELLNEIISKLTQEQKAFVDEMVGYLSNVMGAKGNEVSMALYDVELFKEKNYFPLHVSNVYNARIEAKQKGDVKIKNSGFTQATVKNANSPIVLTPFMDVWADHVNEMSMYHAFVLPLEDFYRVYNFNSGVSKDFTPNSIKQKIINSNGFAATKYIEQLLKDINGDVKGDPRETISKSLVSKFKKSAVLSSASVVIQQPSAIGRAFSMISPKYFIGQKLTEKRHKALWSEVKKYAPVAIIKEMGYFDTNMGLSTREFLLTDEYDGFKEKAKAFAFDSKYRDELLSRGAAYADEATWVAIWEAVKRETHAQRPELQVTSNEFLEIAGKRFTDVITYTQVYDSVFAKSANMRSKSTMMNMATAFMAEGTTTINMFEKAIRLYSTDKKQSAKIMASLAVSLTLNSILVSFVYAARDDDEDKNYWEKYLKSFTEGMIDGINPLTYVPYVKDAWSILQGYDVERADMSLIDSAIDSVTALGKIIAKDTSEMTEEELETHDKKLVEAWWAVADGVSSLLGIPAKNLRRDVKALINVLQSDTRIESTEQSIGDAIWEGVRESIPFLEWVPAESKTDKLYQAIVTGDDEYRARLLEGYTNPSSAITKALRENDDRINEAAQAKLDGDLKTTERIFNEIKAEGNFEPDIIINAINAEYNKLKPDNENSTEETKKEVSIYSASDVNNSFENGNTELAKEIIDELVSVKVENYLADQDYLEKHKGMSQREIEEQATKDAKQSVRNSMTAYWKPLYIKARETGDDEERKRIWLILRDSGLYGSSNDINKTVKKWSA